MLCSIAAMLLTSASGVTMIPRNDSLTGDWNFRQWLQGMLNAIATKVEHCRLLNSTVSTIGHGSVVYAEANNQMALAIYDVAAVHKSVWIGVVEKDVSANTRGTVKSAGYVEVRFEDGLDLSAKGAFVAVSDTVAGAATNAPVPNATVIGTLADSSEYNGTPGAGYNPYAYVYLRSGCSGRK